MQSKIKIIVTCSLMVILFCTCKKYPEDAKFPWQTVQARLTSHSWYLKEFLVDGKDSTYLTYYHQQQMGITGNVSWHYFNLKLDLSTKPELTENLGQQLWAMSDNGLTFDNPGYWNWKPDHSQVELVPIFSATHTYGWSLFFCNSSMWTIKKLTDKEFIIENTSALGKLYRVKFQNNL